MVAAFILSIIYTSAVFLICPIHSTSRSAISKANSVLLGHYNCLGAHLYRIGICPDPYCILCSLDEPMDRNHL